MIKRFLFAGIVCLSVAACTKEEKSKTSEADAFIDSLINEMTLEEKTSQLLDICPPIERLGIPEYNWWNEALHGVARNGRATVFPQAIAFGATFDEELILKVGSFTLYIFAKESNG